MAQQQHQLQQQEKQSEHELLFDTLSRLWTNYLQVTETESATHGKHALEHECFKQHWLQLFLYNYQFVDMQLLQNDQFKSFFNPIPEEICSYLLEQVYQIISASKLLETDTTELNTTKLPKFEEQQQLSNNAKNDELIQRKKKHNFAQLILSTPSDYNKIVALRTFLTNDLGQHLLEFLLKADINLIASQKSLCHLCINLFPNCNWSDNIVPLGVQQSNNISDFIDSFHLNVRKTNKNKKSNQQQNNQLEQQQQEQCLKKKIDDFKRQLISSSSSYKDIHSFKSATKTSDEIALLLKRLLMKCVNVEHDSILNTHVLSITVHNFALGCLCGGVVPTENIARRNDEIIKFELIQLIANCIKNFYAHDQNPNVLDFNSSFSQLLYALVANREHIRLTCAMLLLMFGMLLNLVEILNQRNKRHTQQQHYLNINELNDIDEQTLNACFGVMHELLEEQKLMTATEDDKNSIDIIFTEIYKTLLRTAQHLARYEQQLRASVDTNINNGCGGGVGAQYKQPHRRHKRFTLNQLHCCTLEQRSLACFFQRNIFILLPQLSNELQEYTMRYLLRTGSCCCHYNLQNYNNCLTIAAVHGASFQKCVYKFLHHHMLNTLFMRPQMTEIGTKSLTFQCSNCDEKLKSQNFYAELLEIYQTAYKALLNQEAVLLLIFLKHLKHIAYLLVYDLAAGIMAEVVLPIFRKYKTHVFSVEATSSSSSTSPKKVPKLLLTLNNERIDALRVLHECLGIFVMYLSDIRLIKAFYNEENIKHMEELLSIPELQRGVCDLIKVGIDNITFLGDNAHEQSVLSRRLITLQLNSSDHVAQLFHALIARCAKTTTRHNAMFYLDDKMNIRSANQDIINELALHKPADILYITALQWTLNYELLKTSQLFYNEFAKIYSIVVETEDDDDGNGNGDIDTHSEHSQKSTTPTTTTATTSKLCNLKHGDKTIIDILKLNYNALNCFLMLPSGGGTVGADTMSEDAAATPTTTTTVNECNIVDNNLNNANICHSSSLEALVSSIQLPAATSTISSLVTSTLSTATTHSLHEKSLEYLSFNTHNDNDNEEEPTNSLVDVSFLQQLQCARENDESIVLFDIRRNQTLTTAAYVSNSTTSRRLFDPVNYNPVVGNNQQQQYTQQSNATTNASIIGKLFSMFGSFFSNSRTSTESLALEIDSDLRCLYEPNGECKKLLLKLFEATMAICIKGYQNEEVEKMQKHLRKLKAIIVSNATANWPEHAEQNARDNIVIQALQTLLKIAELSNTLNEPAAIVSNSMLTSVTTDEKMTSASSPQAQRQRARSFNSSNGVELPKLRVSTQLPAKNSMATPPTPRRPVSGESGDADYFSTRASIICQDSELEFSENDNDYYMTADEGYEADGEIPEITDSECELTTGGGTNGVNELWHSYQPISRYRTHIMHDGLCRLVVEILIELSEQCTRNPVGWVDSLMQLANRLFVIRDYLGGPLFLLRGFMPILSCNDERLRELQQSVLELVTHLNTPEVLGTFFSILATKNPPMDILIKYMQHVSANSLKKVQPSLELEFPSIIDGKCISTADRQLTEQIDCIRNYHLHCQAVTPFTRAPCFIPVTHTRLWQNDGITLSLWLEVKSQQQQTHRNSMQFTEDDMRCSGEDLTKSHIVSLGTNQAMLSIYINTNMQLVFEICKPNAQLATNSHNAQTADISYDTLDSSLLHTTMELKETSMQQSSTQNHRREHEQTTNVQVNGSSSFRHALRQTKQVLLNSFSNINFLNGHHSACGVEANTTFEVSNVQLKNFRFPRSKWTHLVVAVNNLSDRLDLTIYIDGLEQHTVSLPFPHFRLATKNHNFQLLAVGDSLPAKNANHNSTSCTESRSTLDVYTPRLNICSLVLFNRKIIVRDCILNLTAMGPDFTEFTQCQVSNWKPNYGYLNLMKMTNANFGNFLESMKLLRQARVLVYTAQQPDLVMGYDSSLELDNTSYGRPYGLILYSELQQNELQSLPTSTILCGGLSTLLYLFGKVVEVCSNANTQALALELLLTVAHAETQLYTEFHRNDYISLIGYVIKSERCSKDVHLLKSIVNNACTQPLIFKKGDALAVNENTIACIVYPRLIISVLHRYSDWHRSGAEQSDVLDLLFRCILALTREKHPQRDFNMEQLQKNGLVKELLNVCKIYVIESPNPVYISKDAAESFVQILAVFAGSPPAPSLLDEIMKLLLLLQKPSECYITHDRAKFYFLLTPHIPAKERSTISSNLSRVTTPFKRSILRSHPGVALKTTGNGNINLDLDAKRLERIARLRKLHSSNSTYKRPLHEFEEVLENVADCTRLNKPALRLLSPIEAKRWRLKFKYRQSAPPPPTTSSPKKPNVLSNSPQRIMHRRLRLHSSSSASLCTQQHNLQSLVTGSLLTFESDSSAGSGTEYNNYHGSTPFHRRNKTQHKTDFYGTVGIMTLQEGLLTLLKNFLCLLPDLAVDEVLKHYVKLEFLLVLANHNSCAVRASIIRLLATLTKRLSSAEISACYKNLCPLHLANQLSIYPSDAQMFEACIAWITGIYGSLPMILNCDTNLYIRQSFGLNALLAITIKTSTSQIEFAQSAFQIIRQIYLDNPNEHQTLIEAGLLQCCIKALYNLYTPAMNIVHLKTEQAIIMLLTTIGEKSIKSVGHINIVWDILNMLSFYQEKQTAAIVRNFRAVQAELQLNWINMYFRKTNVPWSYKLATFSDCTLSQSECRTRLDMLIDRCSQFFTIFEASYTPSDNELKLFEFLVSYGISTNQRCNNFIAWGLQPSRPRDLRAYIVDALWISCQDEFQPAIICDGKMIKALLWLSLLEDLEKPIENLPKLCEVLGINEHDSTWNLEHELERIELNRCSVTAKQKSLLEKTIFKFETLAQHCIESSMLTTRRVAELQNAERKLLMSHMKDYDDTYTYTKWLEIIRRMTHEGAPWYCKDRIESSWQLDDTEGPSRVHTRLHRCHLDIDRRFFMENFHNNLRSEDYIRPLDYLISGYDQQLNISLNSQILYNFPAKYLPVDGEIDGEIIITDHKLYFLATYRCKYFNVDCDIQNITEIWLKRYQHQEKAFEIFLDTNKSLFFSLQNQDDWKIMRDVFCDKIVTTPDSSKVQEYTQQWREGGLTNWEYLMTLNQIAGRTYNDLMQYPVFPWILSNYKADCLDLTDVSNFRKLEKPIAVQEPENETHYINNYNYINSTATNMGSMTLKPYHYSSHYSNSGTVLHFLVRVPPFTGYFLRYQDNNFDMPDRTFHALATTWSLASRDSPTDVKELIPEFFCLPEMFENFEHFNFGCRQNGERVEDVLLPNWCQRDPRLFTLIHRQALESELVRNNLHNWIDLIFGFKQMGESAVEAINVFHPATYAVFLESEISDPIERRAVETMVKTYGQMPRQLFKAPHAVSKILNYCLGDKQIMPNVRGLRWGVYLGSPQLPTPQLGKIDKLPGAEYLVSFNNTNAVYGLPSKSCIMQGAGTDTYNVISWGYDDRIVRIQPLNKLHAKPKNLLYNSSFDDITACGCDANSNQLWFGHKSGRISVYKCTSTDQQHRTNKGRQSYVQELRLSYNSAFRKLTTKSSSAGCKQTDSDVDGECGMLNTSTMSTTSIGSNSSANTAEAFHRDGADLNWCGPTVLVRHTDEITCITLCVEFKIAVTAGRDGIAVIWDLNDWSYIRTIERPAEIHQSPITHVAISPTLGDIVTVHTLQYQQTETNDATNTCDIADSPVKTQTAQSADECFEVTEENLDDFVNVNINPNGKSILRLHSVNARYVQHIVHEDRILAVCYSCIKEGVGINVIATAIEGGIVRLWSSWNLSPVNEIITGTSTIKSITYSTHQHLVVLTRESRIQVWETEGLFGSAPKFPQIHYK